MKIKNKLIDRFQPLYPKWYELSDGEKVCIFKREVKRYTNMPLSFKKLCNKIKD